MKLVMNDLRKNVIEVLKNASAPMTLDEISTAVGTPVKTGTTNAMVSAGVIVKAGDREVLKPSTRKVATYAFVSNTPTKEKFEMTDTRKNILAVLENASAPMTLAELSTALGSKLASGTINSMVGAGLVENAGETTVACTKKTTVSEYAFGEMPATDEVAA